MIERSVQTFAQGLATASPNVVLYEGPDLLIINKPAGMLSHVFQGEQGVQEVVREIRGTETNIAHRLDRHTSGILVCTTTRAGRRAMSRQFENKKASGMEKGYVALLDGEFSEDTTTVEVQVGIAEAEPGKMKVVFSSEGILPSFAKLSVTNFTPKTQYYTDTENPRTLTAVQPITGRTHQIRVVAAQALKKPVTGDRLYNADPSGAMRQMLHAQRMSLHLPVSDELLVVEAPLPADFEEVLGNLYERGSST